MPRIPNFKREHQTDRKVEDLQRNTGVVLDAIQKTPLANAVIATLTTTKVIPAGTNITIGHGLGQVPQGVAMLLATATGKFPSNAGFVIAPSGNPDPSIYLVLQCSATLQAGASFTFLVF